MNWFIKHSKWVFLFILAVGAAVLLLVLRKLFSGPLLRSAPSSGWLPPPPKALQAAVEQAHEDALVAKAEARVQTSEGKRVLGEVLAIPDRKIRRQRLATLLNSPVR
jgi:hypothetical protein